MDEQLTHPGRGVVAGPPPRQQRGAGDTYRRTAPRDGFASVLAHALEEARISQAELARRLDIDHGFVNRIVNGRVQPSLWMLSRLVELLPSARKRLIESALAGATRRVENL